MLMVGYKNYVSKSKILAITTADTEPLKRARRNAEADGRTINCTRDRKIQSLIHLVDGYIVLSALNAETLTKRFYQEW